MIRKFAVLAVASMFYTLASAEDKPPLPKEVDELRQQGYSVKNITAIFSQLVMFSFPRGFVPAFEDTKGGHYIQEAVLEGENVNKWSQMITVTGAKGLASNPNITPQIFAAGMAGGFKRTCPQSFKAIGLGDIKIDNHAGFVAILSCGTANPNPVGESYSESMLLIVIRGERDLYTIQWAERGEGSNAPIKLDNAKWVDRLNKLTPIKLCPVVPGEAAPYPSCTNRK